MPEHSASGIRMPALGGVKFASGGCVLTARLAKLRAVYISKVQSELGLEQYFKS